MLKLEVIGYGCQRRQFADHRVAKPLPLNSIDYIEETSIHKVSDLIYP